MEVKNIAMAYRLEFRPIVLKQLILDCDIGQAELAEAAGVKRPTVNLTVNRGYFPPTVPSYKKRIEQFLAGNQAAMQWLLARGMKIGDIWKPLGRDLRKSLPRGTSQRSNRTRKQKAMVPGDPAEITVSWEVEMITQEAMRHFRIFRNPFIDDIQKDGDIFMSEEH
ncbi:MAG: hypothetical protein GXP49_11505, partial [Deltaproteobacteria bacterium]|nr:hypothetical protein [Deltaproteobacteria bacterium]